MYSSQYDILLIVDDLATIHLLTRYFESKGYSCHGVVSGSKGLEELERTSPKVILLDIILPDLSGYEDKSNRNELYAYICRNYPFSRVIYHGFSYTVYKIVTYRKKKSRLIYIIWYIFLCRFPRSNYFIQSH